MNDFDRAAVARWMAQGQCAGIPPEVRPHRSMRAIMNRCLDARNHTIVAQEAGLIPEELATEILSAMAQTWRIIRKFHGVEIGDRIETGLDDPKEIPARGCE